MKSMRVFDPQELQKLKKREETPDNGEVTIIGGSKLFHGAPLLSLKAASRIVDMVFFASPDSSVGEVASRLKSSISSFIWVPWDEVEKYIERSDSILIGPGFMRYESEKTPHGLRYHSCDEVCKQTRVITEKLLKSFPNKQWVIDAGSLQVMEPDWIPQNAILTPNIKEYEYLFGELSAEEAAKKYKCIIVRKGPKTFVSSTSETVIIEGGNNGLTKGGTGDTLAGVTVALAAENDPFLAAVSASWIVKYAGDLLYKVKGTVYNSDDLAEEIPKVLGSYLR